MKTFILGTLAALAFNVNAATTTIYETTNPLLDTTFLNTGISHVDTTTGLEWLDFGSLVDGPTTLNFSVDYAESYYGAGNGGWRLADETEVYNLFNRFFEPDFDGGTNGIMMLPEGDGQSTLIQSRNSWLISFGTDATEVIGSQDTEDAHIWSAGFYVDENDDVQILGVEFDVAGLTSNIYGTEYDVTGLTRTQGYDNIGVFMVRDYTVVPIPAAIWLFGSGLIALLGIARRKA